MSAPAVALSFEGVSVRYGPRTAVHRLSLGARSAEVVALVGPNGSGKSSLLRAATGLLAPSEGEVRLSDGRRAGSLTSRERARRLAWMPQEEPPGENVSVGEYVAFGRYAHLSRWVGPTSADLRAVRRALEQVDLSDAEGRGVRELSGGERQRARLARALAQETPVLLLDEPTAHLDIGHQLDVLERVRRVARTTGRAVVVALHDLNLASRYADRLAVLSHGHLVAEGRPVDVLSAELLQRVWGVVAEVRRDGATGLPFLLPRLPVPAEGGARVAGGGPRVHVVAGGGSGATVLRRLADEGYDLTAGVLPLFDTDAATAQELGVPIAAELPFVPIGAEARERLDRLLAGASAVVVAPFPVGPTNLANLEALRPWRGRLPIVLLAQPTGTPWDYAGGAATRERLGLLDAGATEVADLEALVAWLAVRLPPGAPGARGAERHDLDPPPARVAELREQAG